jgi:osmotically-inducible protein OsmY
MKKSMSVIRRCVYAILVSAALACASSPSHESTGQFVDDSTITTKVKAELAGDDFFKSFKIGVETYKGVVQLSGFVDSRTAFERAQFVASKVNGIASVRNDLIVKTHD